MFKLAFLILIGLIIILPTGRAKTKKKISNELTRKIPHLVGATIYAAAPFLVDMRIVSLLALLNLVVAMLARKYGWFSIARSVGRKTWGDIFFPIGVLITSLLTDSNWVFAAAMLNLGIADAAAALVGKRFGGRFTYKIAGQTKSIIGSWAFWLTAFLVTSIALSHLGVGDSMYWQTLVWLPLILTAAENAGVYGLDNLSIPILTACMLNMLSI